MVRKVIALLILSIASVNTLNISVGELASGCDASISATDTDLHLLEPSLATLAPDIHDQSAADTDCRHSKTTTHQCHIGHCQYLISSTSSAFFRHSSYFQHAFAAFSWGSVRLPSPDKPPRA